MCFDPRIIVGGFFFLLKATVTSTHDLKYSFGTHSTHQRKQAVHSAPHKNIAHAYNTTIPHASTSAFYHQQYFYNFTTFNDSFYKILTYKF
jgi:hypothetical protein